MIESDLWTEACAREWQIFIPNDSFMILITDPSRMSRLNPLKKKKRKENHFHSWKFLYEWLPLCLPNWEREEKKRQKKSLSNWLGKDAILQEIVERRYYKFKSHFFVLTCISASRVGTVVKPASLQIALFLPCVHVQRHAAGQSVQSGDATLHAAASMIKEAILPPAMSREPAGHLGRTPPPAII